MIPQAFPLVARLRGNATEWVVIGWDDRIPVAVPWSSGLSKPTANLALAAPAHLDPGDIDEWIVPGYEQGRPLRTQPVDE